MTLLTHTVSYRVACSDPPGKPYTLDTMYIKYMTNKNLPYSSRKSTQCPGGVGVHSADSLCYTAETNTL